MLQREGRKANILKTGRWLYPAPFLMWHNKKIVYLIPAKAVVKACTLFLHYIPVIKGKTTTPK
jgi:hypothetical protein